MLLIDGSTSSSRPLIKAIDRKKSLTSPFRSNDMFSPVYSRVGCGSVIDSIPHEGSAVLTKPVPMVKSWVTFILGFNSTLAGADGPNSSEQPCISYGPASSPENVKLPSA